MRACHRFSKRVLPVLFLAGLCCAVAGPPEAPAADWPGFRGPLHNGFSPEKLVNRDWREKPPQTLWTVAMDDDGYAGPAVANGVLYIVDHRGSEDVVRAIDTESGRDLWTYAYPEKKRSNYGHARATPLISDGRVYTLSRRGVLNCIDAANGSILWTQNIIDELGGRVPKYEMSMSPFVDGERLIVVPGGRKAAVAALDRRTGTVIWKGGGGDKPGYATPVAAEIGSRRQYIVFTAAALTGVDSGDGSLLWRLPWETDYDVNAATPVLVGDRIFITSGYRHGSALVEAREGKAFIVWQNKELQGHFNSPVYADGYIYGIGDPGDLVCLEAATGKVAWRQEGFEKGGLLGVDGMLIAVDGKSGDVVLVEITPEAYREAGRIRPLGGQSWTPPVIADGRLYVRSTSRLACIDLR